MGYNEGAEKGAGDMRVAKLWIGYLRVKRRSRSEP